jgi:hypothetical protein
MAPVRYATLSIKNTASIPMLIAVKTSDGSEQTVTTLAPGQETTQLSPVDAIWMITFGQGAADKPWDVGDDSASRGGAGVVR